MTLRLHGFWRATGAYRVRIALALKGVEYAQTPVNLATGEQGAPDHAALNPQKLVPALETDDGVLTQSLAIIEWLEETHPEPPLLPRDPAGRSAVRAMALVIAADVHPINNLRVLKALTAAGLDNEARNAWAQRWIADGFAALEPMIARHGRGWSYGESPTMADCTLIPGAYSAARFGVPLEAYPNVKGVVDRAAAHPAFLAAHPDRQPDAPPPKA